MSAFADFLKIYIANDDARPDTVRTYKTHVAQRLIGGKDMQEFYTPQEVAEILKLEVNTVYEYIRMGKLPAAKIGNRYRIAQEDLKRFIEERRTVKEEVSNLERAQG